VLSHRPYAGEADLRAITDLLARSRPAERATEYPSLIDVREILGTPTGQGGTFLWEDEGGLLGFAMFDAPNLTFEIVPGPAQGEIAAQMIGWATDRARAAEREPGEPPALDTSVSDRDPVWIALLERHGFARLPECGLHFIRPLDVPIPDPQLPLGFTLRPIAGEHESAAWVTLHRAAWGTENMTLDYRLSMVRVPEYDPDLDLVAVAPDGTLAAYCFCYVSREINALSGRRDGFTDPISTHPDYQRRGLSRALVLAGLQRLKARGMDTARTGTSSENVAMQRTAESVGFRLESRTLWFSKRL
jgi:ribosomal protein S18 acetylase RimI-like enzyme